MNLDEASKGIGIGIGMIGMGIGLGFLSDTVKNMSKQPRKKNYTINFKPPKFKL